MINLILDAHTSGLLSPDFQQMIVRLIINFIVVAILIHFLYYPKSHRRDFYFTFQLVAIAIFFLVFFMMFVLEDLKGKTSIGIGIGLFGIFSIMRYRTEQMPVREMTYLFMVISLSVINAIAGNINYLELGLANFVFVAATWFYELRLGLKHVSTKLIQYDRIALITPERREELKEDLEKRTGLQILKIEVGSLDLLKDMAIIKITYVPEGGEAQDISISGLPKLSKDQRANVTPGE